MKLYDTPKWLCGFPADRWRTPADKRWHLKYELARQGLKYCPGCRKIKTMLEFCADNSSPDGFKWKCKICSKQKKVNDGSNPTIRHTQDS